MTRWLKRLFITVLVLVVGYVLAVQALRWMAYGEEEAAAVALMRDLPPPPAGESGYMYLAYAGKDAPDEALAAALAADLAAFGEYRGRYAEHLASGADTPIGPPGTPGADRLPDLPQVAAPDFACGFSQDNCPARLHGHEAAARAWLEAEAPRIRRIGQALASAHLTSPYAPSAHGPFPAYQQLRLPLNDIALQALEGDVAGALPRACDLLADARKHLRNDGLLIDKTVFAALTQGASDLLLRVRELDPALPLPDRCNEAMAPVAVDDYQVCNALRGEFAMMSDFARLMDEAYDGWRTPMRWVLTSQRLQDGWTARSLAPFCTPAGQAAIARGEIPEADPQDYDRRSIDFWAAPISHVLSAMSYPAYGSYQQRLLDYSAALEANLTAIGQVAVAPGPEPEPVQGSAD